MNPTQKKSFFFLFSFFTLFFASLQGEEAYFTLEGHLSQEKVKDVADSIDQSKGPLVLEVNSTSGDLSEVLALVKKIYRLKAVEGRPVTVLIHDNALGPAAMIPFLADELFITYFVSWGDIPFGAEGVYPPNILKNRVRGMIDPEKPQGGKLLLIAEAMSDPSAEVEGEEFSVSKGQTLVLNQNELQKLGLVEDVVSAETFRTRYQTKEAQEAAVQEEPRTSLEQQLENHIPFSQTGTNKIGRIYIGDQATSISQATWIYVKSALDYYKKEKPILIILELNTPGGEVYAAQKISDALKEIDTQSDIPCIAYINNWALSAGAMLAYSCRFISVVKDGSMGAAEPVFMGEGGKVETAPEKINSALRADFANRARFFGRNPEIAEAMVDKDMILVLRHGKFLKLDTEDQIRRGGPDPDIVVSAKGKLLTLDSQELLGYGVADFRLPSGKIEEITAKERAAGKWPASKNPLFQEPFFKEIPNAVIDDFQMDWKTQFFVILASPAVASLLFLGMMIGFYVELNTPGFGLPGSVGLICLFLIVISSMALDVVNMLEVVLFVVGIVFVAIDLFFIPTFGILGIAGVVLAFAGLFGMMLPGIEKIDFEYDTQTFNAAGEVFVERLGWLSGTFVAGVVAILLLGRYVMPTFSGFKRFVLEGGEQEGYIAGDKPSKLPQPGAKGKALTDLRLSGKVEIGDKIYEAVSVSDYINKGEKIVVSYLDGSVLNVDTVEKED